MNVCEIATWRQQKQWLNDKWIASHSNSSTIKWVMPSRTGCAILWPVEYLLQDSLFILSAWQIYLLYTRSLLVLYWWFYVSNVSILKHTVLGHGVEYICCRYSVPISVLTFNLIHYYLIKKNFVFCFWQQEADWKLCFTDSFTQTLCEW